MLLGDATVMAILPVVDMARAQEFYEKKLGLSAPEDQGDGHVIYSCGNGTKLLVYARREVTKAEHTQVAFTVDNLEATVEELKKNGVTFEEYDFPGLKTVNSIATMAGEKSAWLKDPEGNIIGIGQKA